MRPRSLYAKATQLLPSLRFKIGSSRDLLEIDNISSSPQFSTAASSNAAQIKVRPSKEKLARKLDKLEKKREVRAVRKVQLGTRLVEKKVTTLEGQLELRTKRETAQDITAGLEPLSEAELDGMYRGLLSATPEELSPNQQLLSATSALALPAPGLSEIGREDRIVEWEERMDQAIDFVGPEIGKGSLAARLSSRRVVDPTVPLDVLPIERMDSDELMKLEGQVGAQRLLLKLEVLIKSAETFATSETRSVGEAIRIPLGVATRSEWRDLVLASAESGDTVGVKKAFELMRQSGVPLEEKLLNEVMALYASEGRARDCLQLAQHCQENSLPISVATHHHLLSSLLPVHSALALKHLHSLEESGMTPLIETYTLLIASLISPLSPAHLVRRGWDLYAHTRLVAHPIPSVELYSTMIRACSTGPTPSPERAIDLFTEMTSDHSLPPSESTYASLIRTCAREGSQEYYFEGLRFMRQMLDINIIPTRRTFNALLEGAAKHGDLARARWILVKMLEVGGEAGPDEHTLGLVFMTYAAYKPTSDQVMVKLREGASEGKKVSRSISNAAESEVGTTGLPTTFIKAPSTKDPSPQQLSSLLDSSSTLFYPGPLPETTSELLLEARHLMVQAVSAEAISPILSALNPSPSTFVSTTFPTVKPSVFLLNTYLSILTSHAPFPSSVDFFGAVYDRLLIPKNRFSYETMLSACETTRKREVGLEVARGVFKEWYERSRAEVGGEEGIGGLGVGKSISRIWAGMIRILARNFETQESLSLLQRFIATYPPSAHLAHSLTLRTHSRTLPALPSPLRLSSTAYPETSSSPLSLENRPPAILFEDVKLLHLRLANVEDKVGMGRVKGICMAFEGAVRSAREFEENRVRVLKTIRRENEREMEGGEESEGIEVEEREKGGARKGSWKKREGMRAHA